MDVTMRGEKEKTRNPPQQAVTSHSVETLARPPKRFALDEVLRK
jgi:hypothetical protein